MELDEHTNKQDVLARAKSFKLVHRTPPELENSKKSIARRQDVGRKMFWTYVMIMLTLQAFIPIAIGGSYAGLYFVATLMLKEVSFQHVILVSPLIYILGSLVLMAILKLMQVISGGYSVGTSNFFSFSFLFWHILADMIYFCTSTVLYPISGTQIYCVWMRLMGAKVGKDVFVSPENGGFRCVCSDSLILNFLLNGFFRSMIILSLRYAREIDFMNIGDNCGT